MIHRKKELIFSWIFTCLLLGNQCLAVTKQWLPNTNFDNPANWNKGRVPCAKDRVQLHGNKPVSVSLRSSHIISTLSLPMNGEVLFYEGAELSFSEEVSTDCEDPGDIHFVASIQNWFNPYNWQQIGVNKESFRSSPVSILHTDNVPCVHDTVVFPQASSFMVKSVLPVRVAAVELLGEAQNSISFKDFYNSASGSMQFNFIGPTNITAVQCDDRTGCACGYWKFAETICSHVKCEEPICTGAFRPEGSCCDVCGTLLGLDLEQDFTMNDFKHRLANFSQTEYEGVSVATSKTESNFVQVLLIDQEGGNGAQKAAEQLKEVLISDKSFNVADVWVLEQSGDKAIAEKPENSLIIPLAVGLCLLFLFLVAVIFLICSCTKRQSYPFVTVADGDIELTNIGNNQAVDYKENGELGEKQSSGQDASGEMTMENPLYESSTK